MVLHSRSVVAFIGLLSSWSAGCADIEEPLEEEDGAHELDSTQQALQDCSPPPGHASLFFHAHYQGTCVNVSGLHGQAWQTEHLPNDSVSSVRVAYGSMVRLCSDANFAGNCRVTWGSNHLGDFNDQMSSYHVMPDSWRYLTRDYQLSPGMVVLKPNTGGGSTVFSAENGDTIAFPGTYEWTVAAGIAENTLDKMVMGPNTEVKLCDQRGGGGRCEVFPSGSTARWVHLEQSAVGRDRAKSLVISRR